MNPVTTSGGNIFEDLGLPDSSGRLVKAQLAREIAKIIERDNLTQIQAASRLGIDQPKVSMLLRGRLAGFSVERLVRFLGALGQRVEITVRPQVQRGNT